jgi:hypothetical protein
MAEKNNATGVLPGNKPAVKLHIVRRFEIDRIKRQFDLMRRGYHVPFREKEKLCLKKEENNGQGHISAKEGEEGDDQSGVDGAHFFHHGRRACPDGLSELTLSPNPNYPIPQAFCNQECGDLTRTERMGRLRIITPTFPICILDSSSSGYITGDAA